MGQLSEWEFLMPSATEYRQRVAHKLNAFPMPLVTDYPSSQAVAASRGTRTGRLTTP